ncbi:MAG: ribosomal protein S18-alanine N-acetyltransferase [Nitrospirota bacterium]
MDKLIIRDMQDDDIPSIMGIEETAFSSPWPAEAFVGEIYKKYSCSKVAVFEGSIIGYICTSHHFHEANILDLAVHPDHRRRGVATLLMNEAIKELKTKGCVFLYLKVRVSNTGARKFYESFEFKVEGFRKKYYDDPEEDALMMMMRL